MRAVTGIVTDSRTSALAGEVDGAAESVISGRYIDLETEVLGQLAAMWQDFQQMRLAAAQRGLSEADIEVLHKTETYFGTRLTKALRRHPIWPWLSQYPGLGGVHVARLLARIGDPRRFPGQRCSLGHTFPPDILDGHPCPMSDLDGNRCPGVMQPPRPGTGTRSLWHYLGLHVVDGRSPRKTKGKRADWDPLGRTAVLQPDGIADAIVRNRVPVYRERYDATKARLTAERGAELVSESEEERGPRPEPGDVSEEGPGAGAAELHESECGAGLRPFQIDRIARKVAAKAFVGDLLREWKHLGSDEAAA